MSIRSRIDEAILGGKGLLKSLDPLLDLFQAEIDTSGIGSFALLRRGGDDQTTNVNAGDHFEFNNLDGTGVSVSSGGAQDQASGLIELESAGTWLLVCWTNGIFSGAGGRLNFRWQNNTTPGIIGFAGEVNPHTFASAEFKANVALGLLTIAAPAQVEVRIISETLLTQISESDSEGMRALALRLA